MPDQRIYVLVHGAWHGGWCWRRVADRLAAAGHRVFTPTQTGLGERRHLMSASVGMDTFIADVANLIDMEDLADVILVGHSFGGRTITGVANCMPQRLRRLVFLDAALPENGKSAFDLMAAEVRDARLKAAQDFDGGLSLPPPKASAFGISDPDDADWIERHLTPHPLATYTQPMMLEHPIGNGVPATYIRCTAPGYANTLASADYAKARPDWQYLEITTGHNAMVSAPAELTAMLLALP
ncbi:MAG: alpha/beta fold hydrolase [Proteobacteria bacterium]|nr:alpha/beta fold hydrolase [Pseudomonadota bacterium]